MRQWLPQSTENWQQFLIFVERTEYVYVRRHRGRAYYVANVIYLYARPVTNKSIITILARALFALQSSAPRQPLLSHLFYVEQIGKSLTYSICKRIRAILQYEMHAVHNKLLLNAI